MDRAAKVSSDITALYLPTGTAALAEAKPRRRDVNARLRRRSRRQASQE